MFGQMWWCRVLEIIYYSWAKRGMSLDQLLLLSRANLCHHCFLARWEDKMLWYLWTHDTLAGLEKGIGNPRAQSWFKSRPGCCLLCGHGPFTSVTFTFLISLMEQRWPVLSSFSWSHCEDQVRNDKNIGVPCGDEIWALCGSCWDGAWTLALCLFPPCKCCPWLSVASGVVFPKWHSLMGLAPQKSRPSSCYRPESGCARAGLADPWTALLTTSQLSFSLVRISLIVIFSFFYLLFLTPILILEYGLLSHC